MINGHSYVTCLSIIFFWVCNVFLVSSYYSSRSMSSYFCQAAVLKRRDECGAIRNNYWLLTKILHKCRKDSELMICVTIVWMCEVVEGWVLVLFRNSNWGNHQTLHEEVTARTSQGFPHTLLFILWLWILKSTFDLWCSHQTFFENEIV